MVDSNPEFYFQQIHEMLKNKTFENSKYEIFKRTFGKKERVICKLPYFPDRIIHHCIMQVLEPIWRKTLIRDTYSSIKGRGLHDGVRRMKKALKDKSNTTYCLKADVKKFYPSVSNEIMKAVIRKKIKCKDTLWLLDTIIDSIPGLPIGNYLSQYLGNLFLSSVDHIVKEVCKVKYYFRYCDDIIFLSESKQKLRKTLVVILQELKKLNLLLKENYQIFPVDSRGIDFLGYRFFHQYALLRKSIVVNLKNKILNIKENHQSMSVTEILNGLMSYYGWLKHGNCRKLMARYFDRPLQKIVYDLCFLSRINNPLMKVLS
jgi:hypothetical protein